MPGNRARNRLSPGVLPMPIIVEDENAPPASPLASRQPPTRRPSAAASRARRPPQDSTALPRGGTEEAAAVGEDKKSARWYAGRRGSYRVALLAFAVIAIIVGLAVGLTLGLRKKSHSEAPQPLPSTLFPAGSYSFTTALTNVSMGCTTDPSLFRCPPFSIYSPSAPDNSSLTFHWAIKPVTSYSYAISSDRGDAVDPTVAPSFTDLPLALLDANQYSERLVFNLTMAKPVTVTNKTTSAGTAAVTCWFNSTIMTVTMWTRIRADYPANVTSLPAPPSPEASSGSGQDEPWPYMVEIGQVQGSRSGIPDCRDGEGRKVQHDGGLDAGGECACHYANYGLPRAGGDDSSGGSPGNTTSGTGNGMRAAVTGLARWLV